MLHVFEVRHLVGLCSLAEFWGRTLGADSGISGAKRISSISRFLHPLHIIPAFFPGWRLVTIWLAA